MCGAAAGLVDERLGHEAGDHALVLGDRLDRALEEDRVVAGEHGIVAMLEVDLELAGRVFGDGGVGRNLLRAAGIGDRVGELLVVVQVLHVIDLRGVVAHAGRGIDRGLRTAVDGQLAIEQIELQFHRDHRRQALVGEALARTRFSTSRGLAANMPPLASFHAQQQLRHRPLLPGDRTQGARHRTADPVFVADVVAQAGFFDGVAGDVGGDQRHRQADAVGIDLFQRIAGDALAAQQSVHVRQQQVDHFAAGDLLQLGCVVVGQGVVGHGKASA